MGAVFYAIMAMELAAAERKREKSN